MKTSFDKRIVRYENLHNISQHHFDLMTSLIPSNDSTKILDLGSGYGACTREILRKYPSIKFDFYLSEKSSIQLNRSISEISELIDDLKSPSKVFFEKDDIIKSNFSDNTFDIVISKMVIHEINQLNQKNALKEIYRILKPGGKFIYWDLFLDKSVRNFFQEIIREKDRLCRFDTLVRDRYFLTKKEIFSYLTEVGFDNINKVADILSEISTMNRLSEEFHNDRIKINEWHTFIRSKGKNVSPFILFMLKYEDCVDHIKLTPHKVIISCIK